MAKSLDDILLDAAYKHAIKPCTKRYPVEYTDLKAWRRQIAALSKAAGGPDDGDEVDAMAAILALQRRLKDCES